ncbi:MAG: carboxypeptidase-like regulatory domain-containing protein [Salinivirgaceae bacterium]
MSKYIVLLLVALIFGGNLAAQTSLVYGKVSDENGAPLELINVTIKGEPRGTATLTDGSYRLELKPNIPFTLVFSSISHKKVERELILKLGQKLEFNVTLKAETEELVQINIEDKQVRKSTLTRLDPKIMSVIPEASGNFEAIIKTLPGVSSNNELSAQYSVRGGNFDENLVYVNGVEIYRPFLIRSGQQEGMSFINSDMVSSVLFSSGGFEAKYGDKLSSALDIRYKKPTEWGGAVSASLLGASLMLQGDNKSHRFKHISGLRYKTTKYVLNSLETEGDYDPRFIDFQTYLSYELSEKMEVGFLANYAQNSYTFIPEDRITSFGTINQAMQLKMYFDGQEVDKFDTYTGAFTFDYNHSEHLKLSFVASAFNTVESETFDIQSQYWINQVDTDLSSETLGDSLDNLGYGTYLEHARNFLTATVLSAEHKGLYTNNRNFLQWGVKVQEEHIVDNLREWTLNDSAGYSLPYTDTSVNVSFYFHAKNNIRSKRANAYLQNTFTFDLPKGELSFTAGIRGSYWDFNKEFLLSPRGSLAFKPDWESDIVFKFSSGYYYQPSFYKEMRSRTGALNADIKAQKSVHLVLGTDYNFMAWNRPFKLITEVYYKKLSDLISYSIDNVRIIYSGQNDATGYAAGFDVKVNGEFVKGTDSWFSFSLMKTEEDIIGDVHTYTDADGAIITEYPGYIPRPSDQRVNIGVFFQDYFPGNPDYKMHMQINYGTGLSFGPPNAPRYLATGRMKSYQRVDLGFSKILKNPDKHYPAGHWLHHVKEAWISAEVFNLMDRKNTIGHEWVADYSNRQYAVENSLTGRRLNLKLNIQF